MKSMYKLLYNVFETIVFLYSIYLLWKVLNSEDVLPGNNYFLLPLLIIGFAIYWQSRQLKSLRETNLFEVFRSDSIPKSTKLVFYFCIFTGIGFFLLATIAHMIVWSGGSWVNEILYARFGEIIEPTMPNIFWVAIYLVMTILLSVFVSGFLFINFFLGTIFTGASVAIGLHNWLNGGEFDIGVLLKALFDFSINDTLSYLIVIGEFIFAQLLSNFTTKSLT